jgi:hypothetical protein
MTDTLHLTLLTKDKLIIDAAIQIYRNNLYSNFSIDSVWDTEKHNPRQNPIVDVDNLDDPVVVKIDEIVLKRLKEDVMYFREEFSKLGLELDERSSDPLIKT